MRTCLVLVMFGVASLVFASQWQQSSTISLNLSGTNLAEQLVGNLPSNSTPEPTLFYSDGGPFFTYPLMCPQNIIPYEGLTWRGITVGKSYLSDLEELYGVQATRVQSNFAGNFADIYGITLTSKASIDRKLARGFQACVVNWKIAALAIDIVNDTELSDRIESWVSLFGKPEIISWSVGVGESWRYRTLIWPKRGLALYVDRGDLSPQGAWVTTVIFLPPAQDATDLAQWPYPQLQTTPHISSQGEDPGPLNPFDFTDMLATASAQASQPPMITVTPISTSTP